MSVNFAIFHTYTMENGFQWWIQDFLWDGWPVGTPTPNAGLSEIWFAKRKEYGAVFPESANFHSHFKLSLHFGCNIMATVLCTKGSSILHTRYLKLSFRYLVHCLKITWYVFSVRNNQITSCHFANIIIIVGTAVVIPFSNELWMFGLYTTLGSSITIGLSWCPVLILDSSTINPIPCFI